MERIIAHLAHEPDLDDLFAAYPELTIEDVKAALEYAHDAVAKKRRRKDSADAIYLRLGDYAPLSTKVARLQHVLTQYADRLDQFLVVEPHRVRVRRIRSQ